MSTPKTVIITGGNSGIGYATAEAILADGQRVILACRNAAKADEAIASLKAAVPGADVVFEPLDLGSFQSIHSFSQRLQQAGTPIDVLINNAGALPTQQQFTEDGFELQFGVNYLGHFLLTHQLLPLLQQADNARIIHLSSIAHLMGRINFNSFRGSRFYSGLLAYGQSKLANLLFSNELARRLPPGMTSNALHPGGVDSDIFRDLPGPVRAGIKPFLISPERAGQFIADMALSPQWNNRSGEFKSAHGPLPVSPLSRRRRLSRQLYEESCGLTGVDPLPD